MILKFLKANWLALSLALALLGAFVALKVTSGNLATAEATNQTLQARIDLKDSLIAQQNAGLDSLVAQRGEDRQFYLAGIQAANKQATNLEVDAAELLRLPSPATRDEQCAAAEQLLRKELTE